MKLDDIKLLKFQMDFITIVNRFPLGDVRSNSEDPAINAPKSLDSIIDTLFETKLDFIINRSILRMARNKGGYLEAGYVFAPYVPLLVTPTILSDDFAPRKGIMSRYGDRPVRSDYYGVVNVLDLSKV